MIIVGRFLLKKLLMIVFFHIIWNDQKINISDSVVKNTLKLRLKDQFIQKWMQDIYLNSKCINYRIHKNIFGFEEYFIQLPDNF